MDKDIKMTKSVTLKKGVLDTTVLVQVSRQHHCHCGEDITLTLNFPEGINLNGTITTNTNCPVCNKEVIIPRGIHYIENYELLTR